MFLYVTVLYVLRLIIGDVYIAVYMVFISYELLLLFFKAQNKNNKTNKTNKKYIEIY